MDVHVKRLIRRRAIMMGLTGLTLFSTGLAAQTSPAPANQTATPPSSTPFHVRPAIQYPVYSTLEGKPIDSRPPEKSDDKPLFPEQTRAPYHATPPYQVTTLTSVLHAPWALGFLPDGKILITERLPGAFRILDKLGNLSEPISGLAGLTSDLETGLLDVVVDPHFSENHRIF